MNIIFEDNFAIDTNDTEIDYKRTSSMFHGLDGDIAYPFTIATTPKTTNKLGFPNLINVARKNPDTYPVRLKHGNFQIGKGNLKIRTANAKNISADFTTTPGGIPKNIWNKKLNEFDLGSDTVDLENTNNTVYSCKSEELIFTQRYKNSNTTLPNKSSLKMIFGQIFFGAELEIKLGNDTIINAQILSGFETRGFEDIESLFVDILDDYNSSQANNELSYLKGQFLGILTGISNENLTIIIGTNQSNTDRGSGGLRSSIFTCIITPKFFQIPKNSYDESLKPFWNKPYQFPEIYNSKLYNSAAGFNGIINKIENGSIKRNTNILTEKTRYSIVPMFYLTWVIKKIFQLQGYTAQGSFFQDPDIKKALIFNLTTTDKLIDGINYPINIHNNKIIYAQHLPSETLSEYLSMLIDEFGITIAFNEVTKIVDISFFDDFVQKTDFQDLSNFASSEPVTDFVEKKKVQVSWQLSGDSLAKEDTDPYQSIPTKAIVKATNDEYEPVTLKIPGLTKDANNLPQIEAPGQSPLFSQTQNNSPLRFIFWEDNVGKTESTGLSLNLQSPKSIFAKFLKNKTLFEYNSETVRTTALMPLNQILSLDYRKPVKMYGVFLFIDTINLKLKGSKTWYLTELILKKFAY